MLSWRRARLRDKLLISLLGIFLVVFSLVFTSVRYIADYNVRVEAEKDFKASSENFKILLKLKNEKIRAGAKTAVGDFAFVTLVGTKDYDSIKSSFPTYLRKTGADFLAIVDLAGQVKATTVSNSNLQAQITPIISGLSKEEGESKVVQLDAPHEVVVLPVKAPRLIGYFVVGFKLSQPLINELAKVSQMVVSLVRSTESGNQVLISSDWPLSSKSFSKDYPDKKVFTLESDNDRYISFLSAYSNNGQVKFLLQKSMNGELSKMTIMNQGLLVIFAIALILIFFVSLKLAGGISAPVEALGQMSARVATGDFSAKVEVDRGDELGQLSQDLNKMAQDLKVYVSETVEKARMESELETARIVQNNLLPSEGYSSGGLSIEGLCISASECGGDFWFYQDRCDEVLYWVADVTGHGVGAAIVTANLRAMTSYVAALDEVDLPKVVATLNNAIHDCTDGDLMVTLFVMVVRKSDMQFRYINACHNPTMIFSAAIDQRHNVKALHKISGPRLGDGRDASFVEYTGTLPPKATLVFYTDGIVEVLNHEDQMFGEMRMIRTFHKIWSSGANAKKALDDLWSKGLAFADGRALDDDVTIMVSQFEGAPDE